MSDARTLTRTDGGAELEELARAVQGSERPAAEALLRASRPLVCRWALMQTGDPDEAEDVAQEVLVRVAGSLDGWSGRGRFTTWLYRVVSNVVQDGRRGRERELRRRERLGGLPVRRNPATAPGGAEIQGLLRALMGKLTPNQRVAFDLVDLQGFSGAEAAAMQGMNESTFRVHLARGRAVIRRAILEGRTT